MALKVEIKPRERIIIGDTVITNHGQRARLYIEGEAPILREKDIMRASEADTPCKKIYLAIQLMYLGKDPRRQMDIYFDLVEDIQRAAPSSVPHFAAINNLLLTESYYKALKKAKELIAYEKELLNHAQGRSGNIQSDRGDNEVAEGT